MPAKVYDCVIVGGGPAGQSAAIYLARFNRSVVVIDRGGGRTQTHELNENYLGFPFGIHSSKLSELGKIQAQRFGALFLEDEVQAITKSTIFFEVTTHKSQYLAKSIILATGVTDLYPNIPQHQDYAGKSLFWCITCDGYKTRDKKVVLLGDTDGAACTAMQFLNYTQDIQLVTNYEPGKAEISSQWRERLAAAHIPVVESVIKNVEGHDGWLSKLVLESGQSLPVDFLFNSEGAVPNNSLAVELGLTVNSDGYLETTDEQRTAIPFVYAAGDVTRLFAHQIVTAAHEGSMAAQAANYDLYRPEQRL